MRNALPRKTLAGLALFALSSMLPALAAGENWPRFRGPGGSGLADGVTLPEKWSRTDNVVWSAEIPGRGWSSPIVWGRRVFLTSAISLGEFKEPTPGIYGNDYFAELTRQGLSPREAGKRVRLRDTETQGEASKGIRWMVYCLDAESGEVLWEREAARGVPFGGRHRKNTYASETPVTDGERVYAYFGNVGLFCYSMDGELLWNRRWDSRRIYLDFGTASSPVLHEERLYIVNDNEEENFISALDKATGAEVWRSDRKAAHPVVRSGFSTPLVWSNDLRTEIIALGAGILTSYDLSGRELWRLKGTSAVAAPTPVAGPGHLYTVSGSPSENVRPIFAIRAGADGDITLEAGQDRNKSVAWYLKRGGSYITSPLLYRDRLYVLYDRGFFAAFDAASGKELYKVRFERGGNTFSSSPWAAQNRIYCLNEDGDTFVLQAGAEFKVVAKNSLEEMTLATPAIARESLFLRTSTKLYRIQEKR